MHVKKNLVRSSLYSTVYLSLPSEATHPSRSVHVLVHVVCITKKLSLSTVSKAFVKSTKHAYIFFLKFQMSVRL